MKTPAAMARIANIVPKPASVGINAARPVRMSHMANNRKPIFFVKFMIISFL
jgi:hypothetical protein